MKIEDKIIPKNDNICFRQDFGIKEQFLPKIECTIDDYFPVSLIEHNLASLFTKESYNYDPVTKTHTGVLLITRKGTMYEI